MRKFLLEIAKAESGLAQKHKLPMVNGPGVSGSRPMIKCQIHLAAALFDCLIVVNNISFYSHFFGCPDIKINMEVAKLYVNKYIKVIANWCGINEEVRRVGVRFGKKYPGSAKKYELIACHTGRSGKHFNYR